MGTSREEQQKIYHEYLILCEGEDERQFLIAYLNSEERKKDDVRFGSSVDVWNFGGNEQLKSELAIVQRTEGYSNVRTILIMRDAEANATAAKAQIQAALAANGLPVPSGVGEWSKSGMPYVSYLLFPALGKGNEEGTLEHLCMRIIKDKYAPDVLLPQLSGFMNGLKNEGIRRFRHDFKSRIHGFLSMTDPFVGMKIGEAAKAGAFDWSSGELVGLNKCLIEGFDKE